MKSFFVFSFCLFALSCFRAIEPVEVVTPEELPELEQTCEQSKDPNKIIGSDSVSVENVSFSVTNWVREVEYSVVPECILVREDYKPDSIGGRTLQFDLRYRDSDDRGQILVFKIAEYRDAFARFPQYLENRDQELESLIKNPSTVKRWGIEEPVHMRWMDAHHEFYAKAQIVNFKGGRGLLMLTQIGQGAGNIINNEELEFFFQGITDDGVYFVEMSFPCAFDGLPRDGSLEHAKRYNLPEDVYYKPEYQVRFSRYRAGVAKEIDSAPDNRFVPSPNQVRAFIGAFGVR